MKVNDIHEFLNSAKCCGVKLADKYLNELTHGAEKEEMFVELLLMRAYIKALERYCGSPKEQKISVDAKLPDGRKIFILSSSGKTIPLTMTKTICPDVDSVNCLSVRDVEKLKEVISTLCQTCNCF